jgi:hypothetical protein
MATPTQRQRWTDIDGIGLLNGLGIWDPQYRDLKYVRKPFETPIDLKNRILREHENPTSVQEQGLLNGICNEFNLTPYNTHKKTIFELSYNPVTDGSVNTQDIWVYYNISGVWNEVTPQVWGSGYFDAKSNHSGFIVWQNNRYNNNEDIKNFNYSNLLEIITDVIPDNTEIKVVYYVNTIDEDFNTEKHLFTDMNNDSTSDKYTYRSPINSGEIRVYTLDNIPQDLNSAYYNTDGTAKDFLYVLKEHNDRKFSHKWGSFTDSECIWDAHKYYGSGHINSFYDAYTPTKFIAGSGFVQGSGSISTSNSYTGGIDSFSDSLYLSSVEVDDTASGLPKWYPRVYPGKFYMAGLTYYLFENPVIENISFVNGSAILPSGVKNTYHTILTPSGYYDTAWNSIDPVLSGRVYEDYSYPTNSDNDTITSIYRNKPFLPAQVNYQLDLGSSDYSIDFDTNAILAGSGISDATLIYDRVEVPSGVLISYDLNPLNEQFLTLDKYFLFFTTGQTRSS